MGSGKPSEQGGAGLSGRVIKAGVLLCLASIIFGMIVMVKGVLFSSGDKDEDVPTLFLWMGTASCGLFTLGALMAGAGWLAGAASGNAGVHRSAPDRGTRRAIRAADGEPGAADAAGVPPDAEDKQDHRRRSS